MNTLFIDELLKKYIVPLQNYDLTHQTQLLATVQTYIASHCSNKNTCKKLFIHKNTLSARLKTIEKIIGVSLVGDGLFHLQLAIKIFEYNIVLPSETTGTT